MPQITLDIPEGNIPFLLEITEAMGICKNDIAIKDESPGWHTQILIERLETFKSGNTNSTSWDELEKELDVEDEANEL